MTTVTPIRQTPLQALRNIMEVCMVYEDQGIAAESAKQQLPRIRALAAQVIASLSEPHADTIRVTGLFLNHGVEPPVIDERLARDAAAVILNSAMTWGIGSTL